MRSLQLDFNQIPCLWMAWKDNPLQQALNTKGKRGDDGFAGPCSPLKNFNHFSKRIESLPFPPHQGKVPIFGMWSFSFEKDRSPAGDTLCLSHQSEKELQALDKRRSIDFPAPSRSNTPSKQNSTMTEPIKFRAIPKRKMWNGSLLKNRAESPAFQSSNGMCLKGGGCTQGTVWYKLFFQPGSELTSPKG